jgi:hypothetical protein
MAKKVTINIAINTKDGEKSIGDLNNEAKTTLNTLGDMREAASALTEELERTEVGTKQYEKLKNTITQVNTEIKNQELEFEALDIEQKASEFGSFASGLADTATGALALSSALGITNKSSEEMIEGLVQGMAIANTFRGGLEGIVSMQKLLRSSTLATTVATKGGTVAMRIFNTVVKANPIGILITALVAAVSAFAIFSSSSEEAKDKTEDLDEANKKLNETLRLQQKLLNVKIREVLRKKDIESTERLVELETELLRLEDMITDARRDRPDDLQRILEIQEMINAKTLEIAQTEAAARRQALKFEQEARDIRIKNMEKEIAKNKQRNIDDINNINTTAEQREKWAKERADRNKQLREQIQITEIEQRNENEETSLLEARLDNMLTKVKIDNANKIADIRKQMGETLTEEQRKSLQELPVDAELAIKEINRIPVEPIPEKLIPIDSDWYIEDFFDRLKRLGQEAADSMSGSFEQLSNTIEVSFNGSFEQINTAFGALQTQALDTMTKIQKMMVEQGELTTEQIVGLALQGLQVGIKLTNELLREQNEQQIRAINERFDAEREALNASLANQSISREQFEDKMSELEQQRRQEELQAKREAFKQNKALQITNAVMQTAQAVLAAFSSAAAIPIAGVALGPVMAGVAAALGAAQIAVISSQKFQAARGGVVPGQPSSVDSVDAQLASGEMVINSKSAQMFPQALSAINEAGGGIPLAPSVPSDGNADEKRVFKDNRENGPIRAYVVESNMTQVQKRVSRIERNSEF